MSSLVLGTTWVSLGKTLLADPFSTLLPFLVLANAWDWLYGRRAAHLRDEFDDRLSAIGLHGKIGAFSIVLLLRALEWWGGHNGFLETSGLLACVVTFALIMEDVRSIQRKRETLGLGKIPLLSPVLDLFGAALDHLVPGPRIPRPPPAPTPESQ